MPLSRSEQEAARGWLQLVASGDDVKAAGHAVAALQWIAELSEGWLNQAARDASEIVRLENNPGPVVNQTPKDTMIQIRFRAKRSTVSISELPDETKD